MHKLGDVAGHFAVLVERKRLGMSQADLAKAAGISQPDISRIEQGWTPPRRLQQKLATALRSTVDALFPDEAADG